MYPSNSFQFDCPEQSFVLKLLYFVCNCKNALHTGVSKIAHLRAQDSTRSRREDDMIPLSQCRLQIRPDDSKLYFPKALPLDKSP